MRSQAAFFDAIVFLLLTVFSVGMIFVALNSYTVAQDKVVRTSYLVNYLQSTVKALYYVDASTLKEVKSYCEDLGIGTGAYYCVQKGSSTDAYDTKCNELEKFVGLTTVIDLLKKDVSDPPSTHPTGPFLDDKFGNSQQPGRTAMRCALKEIMKPFTFSGYHYFAEVSRAAGAEEVPIYTEIGADTKYMSDVMFTQSFKKKIEANPSDTRYSCADVQSNQLLVVRTPFRVLIGKGTEEDVTQGFDDARGHYVLRACLWPSGE